MSISTSYLAADAKTLNRTAIRTHREQLTYLDVCQHADALAAEFSNHAQTGEVVAIYGEPGPKMTIATLACLASSTPFVLLDSNRPIAYITSLIQISKPSLTIMLDGTNPANTGTRQLTPGSGDGVPTVMGSNAGFKPRVLPAEASYLFFTSGSTGQPKGVIGTNNNLLNFSRWSERTFDVDEDDCFAQITRPSFDVILQDMIMPLLAGASIAFPDEAYRGDSVFSFMEDFEITAVNTVPSVIRTWLKSTRKTFQLSKLKWLFSIGEPLTPDLINTWNRTIQGGARFVNLYGTTETGFESTFYIVDATTPDIVPDGMPIDRTRIRIVDNATEYNEDNQTGEICIEHADLNLGYLDETSAKCYSDNPLTPALSDQIYRTGDRGYFADGQLFVTGRIDNEVKINGVRIQPAEVARKISEHPEINFAYVIAVKPGKPMLLGAYEADTAIPAADIIEFLEDRIPQPFIPTKLQQLDALPLTANGKVDSKTLLEAFSFQFEQDRSADSAEDERYQVISKLLERPIDPDLSFRENGGDSLDALLATIEIPSLTPMEFLLAPSLRRLMEGDATGHAVVRNTEAIELPLAIGQKDYLRLCMHRSGSWAVLPKFIGTFTCTPEDVESVLMELAQDHHILRTCAVKESLNQIITTQSTLNISVQPVTTPVDDAQIQHVLFQLCDAGIDITKHSAAIRIHTCKESCSVFLAAHHLFMDGISLELFQACFIARLDERGPETDPPQYESSMITTRLEDNYALLDHRKWVADPTRLSDKIYKGTQTTQYQTALSDHARNLLMEAAPAYDSNAVQLLEAAFAKWLLLETSRKEIAYITPKAGRTFESSKILGNFAQQAFKVVSNQSFPDILNACNQANFLDHDADLTNIHFQPLTLPLSTILFNYQLEEATQSLGFNQHTPTLRGGLWELQLLMSVTPDQVALTWNYRTEAFAQEMVEDWHQSLEQVINSGFGR